MTGATTRATTGATTGATTRATTGATTPATTPSGARGRLGPVEHARAWERLRDDGFDVLVVGGGVTGSGAALDAATRGLRTALVEARDLGSGTSSRSSKLFHGGLRYLEQLDLALVREALHERDLMVTRLAPHLVRPVPFVYPLRRRGWERLYVGAGLLLYDGLAGRSPLPRHRHLSARALREIAPGLSPEFVGGIRYHDAQTDDARHTATLARTAAAHGAVVRCGTEVVDLLREGGRVCGATVRDRETGAVTSVRARVVVGCTGVWSDELDRLATPDRAPRPPRVQASKGVHVLVPREAVDLAAGLITRTKHSVLFVIPWGDHWVVGTTDTPWDLDRDRPVATAADVDYLLAEAAKVLARPPAREDVVGVYAGLRPLVAAGARGAGARGAADAAVETARVSREHVVDLSVPGLVSVAGGKYTTYRVMARDVVDAAVETTGLAAGPCITDAVPLLGAQGFGAAVRRADATAARWGLPRSRVQRLLHRYGSLLDEVLVGAQDDPGLLEPVPGAPGYLAAEVRYAATHEAARGLDDVLVRRTRVALETVHGGLDSAADAARVVAPVLGWDAAAQAGQVERYAAATAAEAAARACPDDASAVRAAGLSGSAVS